MKDKILIVETQFIVAADLRMIVQKAGFDIAGIVSSAEAAMELVDVHEPAAVLMDIKLSGEMNGVDLAYRLNERNVPFIYISSNYVKSLDRAALATRPFAFIEKPFLQNEVLTALLKVFSGEKLLLA